MLRPVGGGVDRHPGPLGVTGPQRDLAVQHRQQPVQLGVAGRTGVAQPQHQRAGSGGITVGQRRAGADHPGHDAELRFAGKLVPSRHVLVRVVQELAGARKVVTGQAKLRRGEHGQARRARVAGGARACGLAEGLLRGGQVTVPGLGQRLPAAGPGAQLTEAARGELTGGVVQGVSRLEDLPAAQPRGTEREPEQPEGAVLGLGAGGGLRLLGHGPALREQAGIGGRPACRPHHPQRRQPGLDATALPLTAPTNCPLRGLQVMAGAVRVAGPQPGRGQRGSHGGVVRALLRREQRQHLLQRRRPAAHQRGDTGFGQHVRGVVPVPRLGGAAQRVDGLVVRCVPARRAAQQDRDFVRDLPGPLGGEHVAQQRVVAVPGVVVAERLDKAVFPAQPLQRAAAARLSGQCVGKVTRHLLGDAGAEHEQPDLRRLPAQHLVPEIVGDQRLVPRDVGDPAALAHLAAGAHGRQPEPGHPALGAPEQLIPRERVHVEAEHREVGVRLVGRAGQVRRVHVGQVAGHAQPGQLEPGCAAPAEDQPQGRRGMPDQQVEAGQHRAVRELVHIVEHERGRLGQLLCGLGHPQRETARSGIPQRLGGVAGNGARARQRGLDVAPEPRRILVVGVECQPGDPASRRCRGCPRPAGNGLPRPGWPGHHGHPVPRRALDQVDHAAAAQNGQAQPRYPQLVSEKLRPYRSLQPHWPLRPHRSPGRRLYPARGSSPAGRCRHALPRRVVDMPFPRRATGLPAVMSGRSSPCLQAVCAIRNPLTAVPGLDHHQPPGSRIVSPRQGDADQPNCL